MSTNHRHYDITRGHQTVGEDVIIIRPTMRTANAWARALLGELSKDVALAARLAGAAAAIADGTTSTGSRPAREATIARLQVAILAATKVEAYTDEADILADDIHDAMTPLPPCEADGCTQPEHYTGLCWDHLAQRETAVADRQQTVDLLAGLQGSIETAKAARAARGASA